MSVRVVVAEDDPGMRHALEALLAAAEGIEVVAVVGDAAAAVEAAVAERPDVCLLDVVMPSGGGMRAAREIRSAAPDTRLLALSGSEDRTTVVEMLRAGASGYVVKGAKPEEIVEAIHRTAEGEATLSRTVTEGVVGALTDALERDHEERDARAEIERRIRATLDGGLFTIVLQPICELASRRAVGFEALSRFTLEPVQPPNVWFEDAGRIGRQADLELAAARAALALLPALAQETFLTVNVAPTTLILPSFLDAVLDTAEPDRVVLEITEHAPIEHYATVTRALARLRAVGVRVAIDDAGAGFASLRHILRLQPDLIKIDGTLTRDVPTDRNHRALAAALTTFAHETGATIVAEGLESDAQIAALRDLGVRYGQGYRLGRPAALEHAAQSHTCAN